MSGLFINKWCPYCGPITCSPICQASDHATDIKGKDGYGINTNNTDMLKDPWQELASK